MKLLGICNNETASACLMVNGEIVSAASEERFTRIKFDNSFPLNAIKCCLDYFNITLSDIDVVAYAWAKGFDPNLLQNYLSLGAQYVNDEDALAILCDRIKWEIDKNRQKIPFRNYLPKNLYPEIKDAFQFEKGSFPVAEELQPQMMQFKCNYRNLDEAKNQAKILRSLIQSIEGK